MRPRQCTGLVAHPLAEMRTQLLLPTGGHKRLVLWSSCRHDLRSLLLRLRHRQQLLGLRSLTLQTHPPADWVAETDPPGLPPGAPSPDVMLPASAPRYDPADDVVLLPGGSINIPLDDSGRVHTVPVGALDGPHAHLWRADARVAYSLAQEWFPPRQQRPTQPRDRAARGAQVQERVRHVDARQGQPVVPPNRFGAYAQACAGRPASAPLYARAEATFPRAIPVAPPVPPQRIDVPLLERHIAPPGCPASFVCELARRAFDDAGIFELEMCKTTTSVVGSSAESALDGVHAFRRDLDMHTGEAIGSTIPRRTVSTRFMSWMATVADQRHPSLASLSRRVGASRFANVVQAAATFLRRTLGGWDIFGEEVTPGIYQMSHFALVPAIMRQWGFDALRGPAHVFVLS